MGSRKEGGGAEDLTMTLSLGYHLRNAPTLREVSGSGRMGVRDFEVVGMILPPDSKGKQRVDLWIQFHKNTVAPAASSSSS